MKKTLFAIAAVAALGCSSCTKDLEDRVEALEEKVAALEQKVSTNVSSIEKLVSAAANAVTITDVKKSDDGYTITFSNGEVATITNGKDGSNGSDGKDGADGKDGKDGVDGKDAVAPVIGFKEIDGVFYWTVNGELLKNGDANVPVTGSNGKDGADGKDGRTPQFKIVDGAWKVSFDGTAWADVPVSGTVAPTLEMTETDTEYVFTLGETVVKIAKYFDFAIKVENYALKVEPKSEFDFSYTITGADETVKVLIEAVGVEAELDEANHKVIIKTGSTIESAYVLVKAVRNSDGKWSAQYINIKREYYGAFGGVIVSDENEYLNW